MKAIQQTIDAANALEALHLNVKVTGLKRLNARVVVGTWLIGLAIRVLGCSMELNIAVDTREQRDLDESSTSAHRGVGGH